MTIKEKLETIKGKKIVIWCETQEESQDLVDELNKVTGEEYQDCYSQYSSICYTLEEYECTGLWCYGSMQYYKDEKFQIITYKDFVNNYMGDCKIHITDDDIIAILDEKYGKDNWVME